MELSRTRIAIIVIVGLIVLAAIVVPIAIFAGRESGGDAPDRSGRVDCFPEASSPAVTLTREGCEARSCEYDATAAANKDLGVACFYPSTGGLGYSVVSQENTPDGFRVHLGITGRSPFGLDFRKPVLDVAMLSDNAIRLTFDDAYATPRRYRVPLDITLPPGGANSPLYEFKITDRTRFAFQIIRKSTNTVILDSGLAGSLVLSDQFLMLTTKLPTTNVYGLGEHTRHSFRHSFAQPNTWPAFSRDQFPGGDNNLYGVHPFYTCVEDQRGNAHGVFMLNSNAQEYALAKGPMLTWRTVGGVLDFFVFMGPTPENVVQQYTQLIGRPVMPPYWALGFQLCRYGYNSLANLQRAVEETKRYKIPHDVQYADIDHMDERKIFTVDAQNFSGLNTYFQTLRDGGMSIIIILDPCIITNETSYEPYEEMKKLGNANIRWPADFTAPAGSKDTDGSILGFVWPKGKVIFPDFFMNATRQVWKNLIVKHHSTLVFDGIWIDMNEPANFGTNEEKPWNWPEDYRPYWSLHCGNNTWDEPPYRPMAAYMYDGEQGKKLLSDKTVCMNGVQGENDQYKHYDVHSLYGWSQSPITLEAARAATGERSYVISRSTYPGSGKSSGHWLGDNASLWPHLRDSIIGMLDFNLFGIPYIGADICGFFDDTTEELCLRWMQLGAFYPFCRNHNGNGYKEQHPGALGDRVGIASRDILETRYWLLPYLYTLFHESHTHGNTVVRPLHHEFPSDEKALGIDRQFLWGSALLISPILEEGQTSLTYYLPEGRWYHFYTGEGVTGGQERTIGVTLESKPELHMRGGHIIPMQAPANNTKFSRQNTLQVRVMLDKNSDEGKASGALFWDDGKSVDTYEKGNYVFVTYNAMNKQLHANVTHNQGVAEANTLRYDRVIVYGVTSATTVVVTKSPSGAVISQFTFDQSTQMLNVTITGSLVLVDSFSITWS